jgi:hypothetical protein
MKEYNMKIDFLHVGIIIVIFIIALAGLYYYDKQSDILTVVTERVINIF